MNQRSYNKLYVNKNREDGSEGIFLGYKGDENEIILYKDKETYFHIPAYTEHLRLIDTDLISNGAVGGGFPAASDRIFKSQKGYGDVTPHGNPSVADGMWFCSWLYGNIETGEMQWMDRYYQPGKFDYNTAINQLFDRPDYVKKNPVFKDVVSTMVFEPGVLYKYFHQGERTAAELLKTFEGTNSKRLKMHLLNWGSESIDRSPNNLTVNVQTDTSNLSAVYGTKIEDGIRIFNPTLRFDNDLNINAKVEYNSNYLFENEFTWSFWAYSKNWQSSPSTQLIGNLSTRGGGVGLFIDTLETFPFIAIPETNYGHVIFINEKGSSYLDKSVQTQAMPVNPVCYGIDSNNHVVVCNKDSTGVIYKLDHAGNVIKTTKNVDDPTTLFVFPLSGETPKQLLCGFDDDFHVVTNGAIHTFDTNFNHKRSLSISGDDYTKVSFRYSTTLGTAVLDVAEQVYDVKFLEQDKWSISSNDGNLYLNNELFYAFDDIATNFSIGPDNNIWITHGLNKISVLNPSLSSIVDKLDVGSPVIQEGTTRRKNISFVKRYTRKTNISEWNMVVFYTDEKVLYYYNLSGKLVKTLDLATTFDAFLLQRLSQSPEQVEFLSQGDFTGYERQRIFSKLPPYSNAPQLCLKISTQDTSKSNLIFNCPIKQFASMQNWEKDSWKHFVLTFNNKVASVYCNSIKLIELKLNGQERLNFETQPSFFIGSPTGGIFGLNSEVKCVSNIFNGKIGDIRIFDYAMNSDHIVTFDEASTVSQDLIWPLPIPSTQYVEQIERIFKHKLPGSKSQFFKLKLTGTGITDPTTRAIVEEELLDLIKDSKPAYTDLIKIEWID